MEKIYSKVSPETLLHIVIKEEDFIDGRLDVIDSDNWLQLSLLKMNEGKTFRPHRHLWNSRDESYIAQESWVVLKGSVKAIYYDLDNEIIAERVINEGEISVTLEGGHNYLILENNSCVLEFKTGKYQGQQYDKTFID